MKAIKNANEAYTNVYSDYDGGTTLKSGETAVFAFPISREKNKRYRLFVTGETASFYMRKDEPDGAAAYRTLTDSLSTETRSAHYSLDVTEKKLRHDREWRAYKKIMWKPQLSYLPLDPLGSKWSAGFTAKTENLRLACGGKLLMRVVVYKKTAGVDAHSPVQDVLKQVIIDVPDTCGEWTTVTREIEIPCEETSFVGVWFEGSGYEGKALIERPFLTDEHGYNVLPDFDVPVTGSDKFDWTGQCLSKKERLDFEVKLNGETIFDGEKVERIHRCSEWELELPWERLNPENTLEIRLKTDYHDAVPYTINEVSVIESAGGRLSVIAVPKIVAVGERAFALVRTREPNETLTVEFDDGLFGGESRVTFPYGGLNAVVLTAKREATNAKFTLSCGDEKIECTVRSIIAKKPDGVKTGSGDMVYVEQTEEAVEEFFAWYVANNLGNLVTVRPTYRWSGSAALNRSVWAKFVRLCEATGLDYAHMLDGRELPGISANPSVSDLDGTRFLGRQHHERDGAFVYWGRGACGSITEEQYVDMCVRMYLENPDNTDASSYSPEAFTYRGGRVWLHIDPELERDYRVGAEYVENRLCVLREKDGATRHTGPTWLFPSFAHAGYEFVGAETMYSSLEPLMAALRGAKKCYGLKSTGVHHALQWCNSPLSTKESDRRFRLALYLGYILGADETNVEEGLWRIEEYYEHCHRFSATCREKARVQSDFYDYVRLNERRGALVAPVGFIQGRYDAFSCFVNAQPWGIRGVPYGGAEKSWNMLKTVYPLCKPGELLYRHRCPTDEPVGYFSGTPFGQIDVIPYDADLKLLSSYRALAFIGYNRMTQADAQKLYDYVRGGGKLILTRAHLTSTTDMNKVMSGELDFEKNALDFAADPSAKRLVTVRGKSTVVNPTAQPFDKTLVRADDGSEVAGTYRVGDGEIIMFNAYCYPSGEAISEDYERTLKAVIADEAAAERIAAECGDDAECAVYRTGESTADVYVLAIDWFRDPDKIRRAAIRTGEKRYELGLKFGTLVKAVVNGADLAYSTSENAVVESVGNGEITVRGYGKATIKGRVCNREFEILVDFSRSPAVTIKP